MNDKVNVDGIPPLTTNSAGGGSSIPRIGQVSAIRIATTLEEGKK